MDMRQSQIYWVYWIYWVTPVSIIKFNARFCKPIHITVLFTILGYTKYDWRSSHQCLYMHLDVRERFSVNVLLVSYMPLSWISPEVASDDLLLDDEFTHLWFDRSGRLRIFQLIEIPSWSDYTVRLHFVIDSGVDFFSCIFESLIPTTALLLLFSFLEI